MLCQVSKVPVFAFLGVSCCRAILLDRRRMYRIEDYEAMIASRGIYTDILPNVELWLSGWAKDIWLLNRTVF